MSTKILPIGALALGVALAIGACSGADSAGSSGEIPSLVGSGQGAQPSPSASAPDPSGDHDLAFAKFQECMKEHGVSVSTGGIDGPGGNSVPEGIPDDLPESNSGSHEDFEVAQSECEPLLDEAFGSFQPNPEQEAEMADQLLELQKCLAEEGIEVEIKGNSLTTTGGPDQDQGAFDRCSKTAGLNETTVPGPGSE